MHHFLSITFFDGFSVLAEQTLDSCIVAAFHRQKFSRLTFQCFKTSSYLLLFVRSTAYRLFEHESPEIKITLYGERVFIA